MQRKKILITGARQGMGRECARALASRGHEVFATTETEQQAEELSRETKDVEYDMRVERNGFRSRYSYK